MAIDKGLFSGMLGGPSTSAIDAAERQRRDEELYNRLRSAQGLGLHNAQSIYPYPTDPRHNLPTALGLLLQRLEYSLADKAVDIMQRRAHNLDHLQVHVPAAGDVIIFVVCKGEPMILRDERQLYPSDKLVAQFRMLQD